MERPVPQLFEAETVVLQPLEAAGAPLELPLMLGVVQGPSLAVLRSPVVLEATSLLLNSILAS